MTMTKDRRELYHNMTDKERLAIDEAFEAAWEVLVSHDMPGVKLVGDDRAENLVGAIARFVEDCKNSS